MNKALRSGRDLVFSYLTLRKAIGVLGVSFPIILFLGGKIVFQTGIQISISHYYHTGMGSVFVGTMFVIGFYLLSYKGYDRLDDLVGDLACVFAVGIALFPTHVSPLDKSFSGYVHFISTVFFFLMLIYFSLFLFTKTNQSPPITGRKRKRNWIYRICGFVMLFCLTLIAVFKLLPDPTAQAIEGYKPVFWLEALAIEAFGFSWLTKGEAILKDVYRLRVNSKFS